MQNQSATDRRKERDLEYKRKLKAKHQKIVAQDEYKKNRNLHAIEYGQSLPYSGHARDGGYGPKDYVSSTTQRARERSHRSTGYWQDSWGQRPAGTSVPNTSMTPRAGEDQTPALSPGYPTSKEGRSGPMRGHVDYTPRTAPPDYYGMMVPPTPAPRSKLPPSQHIDPQDLGNNGPQVIEDVNNEISNTLNPQQDENSPWGTAARIAGGAGALGYGARALYNKPKHPAGYKPAVPHPNPNWRNVWGTFGTQASGMRGPTWDAQRRLTGGSQQQPIRAIGNQIKRDAGSLRNMMQPKNVGASGGAPTGSPVKKPVWGLGSQPGSTGAPVSKAPTGTAPAKYWGANLSPSGSLFEAGAGTPRGGQSTGKAPAPRGGGGRGMGAGAGAAAAGGIIAGADLINTYGNEAGESWTFTDPRSGVLTTKEGWGIPNKETGQGYGWDAVRETAQTAAGLSQATPDMFDEVGSGSFWEALPRGIADSASDMYQGITGAVGGAGQKIANWLVPDASTLGDSAPPPGWKGVDAYTTPTDPTQIPGFMDTPQGQQMLMDDLMKSLDPSSLKPRLLDPTHAAGWGKHHKSKYLLDNMLQDILGNRGVGAQTIGAPTEYDPGVWGDMSQYRSPTQMNVPVPNPNELMAAPRGNSNWRADSYLQDIPYVPK